MRFVEPTSSGGKYNAEHPAVSLSAERDRLDGLVGHSELEGGE